MYEILLLLHSYLRWIIVALMIVTSGIALRGMMKKSRWSRREDRLTLFTVIAVDLQLVIGVLLYGVFSPVLKTAFSSMGSAMRDGALRFWLVEHSMAAVLAIVFVHVARAIGKRATSDEKRYRVTTICFGLALLCVLAAIPWPFRVEIARPLFRI